GFGIELATADDAGAASAVLAAAFGVPSELTDALSAAFAALDDASCYVIRVDDEVVATAAGATIDGVTGVFNVATLPEHRGRGLGAALTARAARDGFDGGAWLAYLQSSAMGHGVYRKLGFRDVEEYVLLTRPA